MALGKKTNVADFINWLKKHNDNLTKAQNEQLSFFIKNYENFWSKENKSNDLNNEFEWNLLEKNIYYFFTKIKEKEFKEFKLNYNIFYKSSKENFFMKNKNGYLVFSFVMQEFYIKEITKKIKRNYDVIESKLKRFCSFINEEDYIVSLNYTNFLNFIPNNKIKLPTKVYFLHYIIPGILFSNYNKNLTESKKESDPFNYINLGDWMTFDGLIDLNSVDNEEKRLKYLKKVKYFKSIYTGSIKVEKYYQLLILGNENIEDSELCFLSKNQNPNLFIQNYPKKIINDIKIRIMLSNELDNTIYLFGYSFGDSDKEVNLFLEWLINNNFKICLLFFNEDKDNIEKFKVFQKIKNFYNNFLNKEINKNDFLELIHFI